MCWCGRRQPRRVGRSDRRSATAAPARARQETSSVQHPHPTTEGAPLAQNLAGDLPNHVTAFLYKGSPGELEAASCSKRYELSGMSATSGHPSLITALDLLLHATNFLNLVLQRNKSREQHTGRDAEWYLHLKCFRR
ncbi:hypothetical protein XELAEV_18032898mg [Xenopus laevis]|uniref:Uncharacterized protein n=1 Tax=Xenopus laevis TaxID=8355 RepID=A0A974HDI1_XENLA|nr:hypothetical protein XELAEV_18032898mg [Xenopus laevis]